MGEILEIINSQVKIGEDGGKVLALPIDAIRYPNPGVGDQVKIYRDGDEAYVVQVNSQGSSTDHDSAGSRRVNKILYVLLTTFFAPFGVQRFIRGQVGLGLFMLLVGWWITLGVWPLVDFIISLVKLSSYPGDDYVFDSNGRWVK